MQVLLSGALVALASIAQAQVAGYGQCMICLPLLKGIITAPKLILGF